MDLRDARTQLVIRCRSASRVPWWTQGAGSNVSVKDGDTLWIKASGKRLDQIDADTGIAGVRLAALRERLAPLLATPLPADRADAQYRAALADCRHADAAIPSMETAMHALLPGRDVLHLHALSAVVLAEWIRRGEPAAVERLMADAQLSWRYVPATLPGWALAAAVAVGAPTDALLLANHGLILQGDAASLLARWRALEAALAARLGPMADVLQAADAMQAPWLHTPARAFASTPDVAVFTETLRAITEPVAEGQRRLRPGALARDVNAAELWAAHVALTQLVPSLPALPPQYVAHVAALPQEKLRQAQIAKDTDSDG